MNDKKFFDAELKAILASTNSWAGLFELFDSDPNVFFYIKNIRKEFLWMNSSLKNLHGIRDEDYRGRTDYDYSSVDLAFLFQKEDEQVFQTRKAVVNQPWIVNNQFGRHHWYISSKTPLFSVSGKKLLGLAGMMRNVSGEAAKNPLNDMREAIDHIFRHYGEKLEIGDLASKAFLSVSQFERRFAALFRIPPSAFILKVRIDASIRFLIEGDDSITEIAQQCGFFDNSHFTRHFKRLMGCSPLQFRKEYALKGDSIRMLETAGLTRR